MEDNELYKVLLQKGYPEEFCKVMVTRYLRTDYTKTRMLGYLYRYESPTIEEVVDEMLAILSDRDAIVQKKEMEDNQAKLNDIYNRGLFPKE